MFYIKLALPSRYSICQFVECQFSNDKLHFSSSNRVEWQNAT